MGRRNLQFVQGKLSNRSSSRGALEISSGFTVALLIRIRFLTDAGLKIPNTVKKSHIKNKTWIAS